MFTRGVVLLCQRVAPRRSEATTSSGYYSGVDLDLVDFPFVLASMRRVWVEATTSPCVCP